MRKGFTLIELMIVVAIIAIIAAIAIPGLLRARIASNETACIGTLRSLSTCETQFRSAVVVDVDGDGAGEFGWLQELTGSGPYRTPGGISARPTNPGFMTSVLGTTAAGNGGVGDKSGYSYLMWLPGDVIATSEPGVIAPTPAVDSTAQEVRFACYGWPTSLGNSGNRAFVVTQHGEVFSTANAGAQNYTGTIAGTAPLAGAAFVASPAENPSNLEGQLTAVSSATDTYMWLPSGN